MKTNELKADLEKLRRRYYPLNRKGKSQLLTEVCDIYGYNGKYLIQAFNDPREKQGIKRGRKKSYLEVLPALVRLWLATDQMCSKRLKAAIPLWLPYYDEPLSEGIRMKLLRLSAASIDRLLRPHRLTYKGHGLGGTKPGYLLKNQIPLKTEHWDVTRPGFVEADTVAHCGNSMAGSFIWSITLTDIASCWTENRAVWNKGAEGVVERIQDIEKKLPFLLLGFDCDNGSEFLNYHLVRYFSENRQQPVGMTRSRAYRKNDNAHVEQKNWSHVRHLLGYDRFDNPKAVTLINDLYANEWSLYQNYFMPTQKLIKKEKINSKYKRQYDKPQTPYQRLLAFDCIDEVAKQKLSATYETLNPFLLKKTIDAKLRHIFNYASINKKTRTKI